MKRFLTVFALLTLLGAVVLPSPASAQATSPLQDAIDPLAEGLAEVKEGLAPVEEQLDPAIAGVLDGLDPLLVGLQEALAQLEPTCEALDPILEGIAPLTTELQTLLDADVSGLPIVGTLQPVVDTINGLVADALNICAAEAEVTTTTTAPPADGGGGAAPAEELPVTGGPAGLVLSGLAALGSAGAIFAARRRLF